MIEFRPYESEPPRLKRIKENDFDDLKLYWDHCREFEKKQDPEYTRLIED